MTTHAPSRFTYSDIYDPDDVGLRGATPPLERYQPKLEPSPGPTLAPSDTDDDTVETNRAHRRGTVPCLRSVASRGDAVLINQLSGGKAMEVERMAATELLASDDQISEGSPKGAQDNSTRADNNDNLAALAAGALNIAAQVTTLPGAALVIAAATNDLAVVTTVQAQIVSCVAMKNGRRRSFPNSATVDNTNELPPMKELSSKLEHGNGLSLPSISDQFSKGVVDIGELQHPDGTNVMDKESCPIPRQLASPSPPRPSIFAASQSMPDNLCKSLPASPVDKYHGRGLPSMNCTGHVAISCYPYSTGNQHRVSFLTDGAHFVASTPGWGSNTTGTPSTDQSGSTPVMPSLIDRMSIDGITNPQVGGFHCVHQGCNAQPFQTQYLLNSHANVHSSNRPHYCPVKDCPRSEGGRGFKRKNEMIRHGLVHESPGYVCPFCIDREHRYPRPDNLQRHVRVHHIDKDKDDPQLRDVLAQRPEGPSRGRRRRGGNT